MRTRPGSGRSGRLARRSQLVLPLLRPALERRIIEPRLRELLESTGVRRLRLTSGRVVTGKPGSRALIEYGLAGPAGDGQVRVIAKQFARRAQARRVYRAANSLSRQTSRSAFAVPRPIGWLPELALVAYIPVPGHSLGEAILSGGGEEHVRRAARALAALHSSRLPLDRCLDLRRELLNLEVCATLIALAHPQQADASLQLADELKAAGGTLSVEFDVPIHKDFHYQHVIAGRKLTLLDLDEMRFGDPSFDLAHFCEYLELLAEREHCAPEAVEPLTRSFLAEYARRTGWKADERFGFFAACACLKIAKQLATERGVWPRPHGAAQRAQLAFALERGLSLARSLC